MTEPGSGHELALLVVCTRGRGMQSEFEDSWPAPGYSLTPSKSDRWQQVQRAYDATERMFFGPRVGLNDSCKRARTWLASTSRR